VTDQALTGATRSGRNAYLRGCALVILGGLVLSLGVFCIRNATESNAWQYIFWRALGFTTALVAIAWIRDHRSPVSQLVGLCRWAWIAALCMALSQVTFISSIKAATFAEVFLICSLAPVITAALAWPLLKERIGWVTVLAVILGIAGVVVMTGGELHATNVVGQFIALISALAFAGYILCTRGSRPQDLDAALIGVGILTAIAGAIATRTMGLPLMATPVEAAIGFGHGAALLSAGLFLFGQGSRFVPAVTFTLLAQAEAVLSPIWGYLFFAEMPTQATVLGGALILTAVLIQAMAGTAPQKPVSQG
jgi:drug/metabolite transporter (DMT)-like permease